jgi:uncharacterized tellurite resistance protein B-like protein
MALFDLFKSKNEDSRKSYLKELIRVARADGQLEKREYDLILNIGEKLSCTHQEIEALSLEVENDQGPETRQSKRHRLELLFDLVAIMMIDEDINPKELSLCKSIAMKSGFEPAVIDDIVYRINVLTSSGKSIAQARNEAFEAYNRV